MIVTFLIAGVVVLSFTSGALFRGLCSSDRRRGCVAGIGRNGDVQDSMSPVDEGDTTMTDLATRPAPPSSEAVDDARDIPHFLGIFPVFENGMLDLGRRSMIPATLDEARRFMLIEDCRSPDKASS